MAQQDPFQWARDFYNVSSQRAAQEQNDAQRSLLSVFTAEAQRQQPWSDLPVDLAKLNKRHEQNMELLDTKGQYLQQSRAARANAKWMEPGKLGKLITQTADSFAVDPAYLLALGQYESGFNPSATSPTGAAGVVQFTKGTWAQFGQGDRYDPVANVTAGAKLTKYNEQFLKSKGIEPTPANLYLAHQQGAQGAVNLLSNPNARAGSVTDPQNISVNNGNPNGTAGEFVRQHTAKFMSLYEQHKARLAKSSVDPKIAAAVKAFTAVSGDPDAQEEAQQEAAESQADEDELNSVAFGDQY